MDEARKVNGFRRLWLAMLFVVLASVIASLFQTFALPGQESPRQPEAEQNLLKLLAMTASPESIDYVQNKTQFQLHTLLTEQRHPKTWNLSEVLQKDISAGLKMLLSVDEDIVRRLDALALNKESLEQAAGAIQEALLAGNKIFIYGCGATGRLAKQMESSFWRPFWKRVKGMDKIISRPVQTVQGFCLEVGIVDLSFERLLIIFRRKPPERPSEKGLPGLSRIRTGRPDLYPAFSFWLPDRVERKKAKGRASLRAVDEDRDHALLGDVS